MHRNYLIQLLEKYAPYDAQEIEFKQRMITFVKQYPDCFERTLSVGHITASAWLINKTGTHALLMHHAKLNQWFQLGGHCDGDSDALAVALREAQEESGLEKIEAVSPEIFDIDIHAIPANAREKEHDHYDVRFLLRATTEQKPVKNSESRELRWFCSADRDTLPTQNRSIIRMFTKWHQGFRFNYSV